MPNSVASSTLAPVSNFFKTVRSFGKHFTDPLAMIKEIVYLSERDADGNIWVGLDKDNFKLWRNVLQGILPKKIFGPILIPTQPDVIKALLELLKIGEKAAFSGNHSTDTIRDMVGSENPFAPVNEEAHLKHKSEFKKSISSYEENVKKIAPIVQAWITDRKNATEIDDESINILTAKVMLAFLLNPASAENKDLIYAIRHLKQQFVDESSLKKLIISRLFTGFYSAKTKLSAEIAKLYTSPDPSYPATLKSSFALAQATDHILSLMMVGFDNLQSSLTSVLIRLAEHPEYHAELEKEVEYLQNVPSIRFNLDIGRDAGGLRLAPPVWLQSRKLLKEELTVSYTGEGGIKKSLKLPAGTLVLIPNFVLGRTLEKGGGGFAPHERSRLIFPSPFSTGPNACPGRNIGYAAAGVLAAMILKQNYSLIIFSAPDFDPKTSLKWKNIDIDFQPRVEKIDSLQYERNFKSWV